MPSELALDVVVGSVHVPDRRGFLGDIRRHFMIPRTLGTERLGWRLAPVDASNRRLLGSSRSIPPRSAERDSTAMRAGIVFNRRVGTSSHYSEPPLTGGMTVEIFETV